MTTTNTYILNYPAPYNRRQSMYDTLLIQWMYVS